MLSTHVKAVDRCRYHRGSLQPACKPRQSCVRRFDPSGTTKLERQSLSPFQAFGYARKRPRKELDLVLSDWTVEAHPTMIICFQGS